MTHFRASTPFGDESLETQFRPFPNYSRSLLVRIQNPAIIKSSLPKLKINITNMLTNYLTD